MNIDLENCEGAVILDGLNDAIISIVDSFEGPRILYSTDKIISILMERGEMSEEDALEFFSFNILGLYAGSQNPIFLSE